MAYHTILLHKYKKVNVKKSYDLQKTDPQIKMDDHDLQRQTRRYKLLIIICRDRHSSTNG